MGEWFGCVVKLMGCVGELKCWVGVSEIYTYISYTSIIGVWRVGINLSGL